VRVEGVFLNTTCESPIANDGNFSVGGLEMGTYLVEVFQGQKLRHVQTVEIDAKQASTRLSKSISPNLQIKEPGSRK
jgi:hypothetical protein